MRLFKNIFLIAFSINAALPIADASLTVSSVNLDSSNDIGGMHFTPELLQVVVKYGQNPDNIPMLHYAIKMKDEAAVRLLLEHGIDPNLCHYPETPPPLFVVNEPEAVELLLAYGAIVNVRNSCGQSPLHMAICRATCLEQPAEYFKIVDLLIKAGADVNAKDWHGNTALSMAGDREDIRNFLISHGAQ